MPSQDAPIEFTATVKARIQLNPKDFALVFEPSQKFSFLAGQFLNVLLPSPEASAGKNAKRVKRAYSIASSPDSVSYELCVTLVDGGKVSNFLYSLKKGDSFTASAPYGRFTYKTDSKSHVCFIATGTGLAPFRSMVASRDFQSSPPVSTTLLFGTRYENESLYKDEFEAHCKSNFFRCVTRPSDDWLVESQTHFKGRVTDFVRDRGISTPLSKTDFYLCGNGSMIVEMKKILISMGVERSQIHLEIYYTP